MVLVSFHSNRNPKARTISIFCVCVCVCVPLPKSMNFFMDNSTLYSYALQTWLSFWPLQFSSSRKIYGSSIWIHSVWPSTHIVFYTWCIGNSFLWVCELLSCLFSVAMWYSTVCLCHVLFITENLRDCFNFQELWVQLLYMFICGTQMSPHYI